ncbi:MAG: helix-turn-helix domain-containing protein [Sulfuricurvum sp.]|nr:helix-turn-helix domain-containing protein [Sulfuricurvum sp.]
MINKETIGYSFGMIKLNGNTYQYSAEIFFEMFDDRLKLMIIWYLSNGSMRFKELSKYLQPITNKTLSAKLKQLEELHLIEREVFAEVPPRVEYTLSPHGQQLKPVIDEVIAWSQHYAKTFGQTINEE